MDDSINSPGGQSREKNSGMNGEDTQVKKRNEWMGEVRNAALAGVITIVVAIVFMANFQAIHDMLVSQNLELIHTREFIQNEQGGKINYLADQVRSGNAQKHIDDFTGDLELLKRRFQRGQFEMVTIPGSDVADEVKQMRSFKDQFSFEVESSEEKATLYIRTTQRGAKEALHQYLNYLSNYWMVNQRGEKSELIDRT